MQPRKPMWICSNEQQKVSGLKDVGCRYLKDLDSAIAANRDDDDDDDDDGCDG